MRWLHPRVNDTRRKIKFAWFPTQVDGIDDDKSYTVWLEYYTVKERFDECFDGENAYDCWRVVKREVMPFIMKKV